MATRKKPPRPWEIDDLEDLGRQGELYLKAIPVLILEKWVREKRQEGKANYIRTKELARHLVSRKFVAGFKPKGTSALGSVLVRMQNSRNLTAPPLIELRVRGTYWINLPHYEALLQEYRQRYRKYYPAHYRKLFPEGEPEWELPSLSAKRAVRKEAKPIPPESATLGKPPRPWDIDDLLDLGKRGKVTYLKAIPVLILDKWVRGKREKGVANWVRTKEVARHLERSKLVPDFKPKGTSNILAALTRIQKYRNLTCPPLIESRGKGMCQINLPHYEPLLQEYRQIYRERYPEDYGKLFPEEEPEWEPPSPPKRRAERKEAELIPSEAETQDKTRNLLAPLEQALREREQIIERLTEENQKLQAELVAVQAPERRIAGEGLMFVHTSPDFHDTVFGRKVTSIEDTIRDMLQRAGHSIRISTRQMDMFDDELIRLKQSNPDLEITVLSRGPEGAEGTRKKIAGTAFVRMKKAGIKLPIEQVLLHSRMVVVDEQEVLVSSADLDYTQMEKEFNSGIWTDDPDVVAEAIRYFDNLLKSPTVRK